MRVIGGRALRRAAEGARPRSFSGRKTVEVSATHLCSPLQSLCALLARGPRWISLVVALGQLLSVTIPKAVSNETVHQTPSQRTRLCSMSATLPLSGLRE